MTQNKRQNKTSILSSYLGNYLCLVAYFWPQFQVIFAVILHRKLSKLSSSIHSLSYGFPLPLSQTGEGYLDLENAEDDPDLNEPTFDDEYLDPGESLIRLPGSPTSEQEKHAPLPPLPTEDIELEIFEPENPKDEEKQKFILQDPPKERVARRKDSELEKARKDTLDKEKPKESVSQVNDDDFISQKEQLHSEDEDKDVCERNSGVFEYPPEYEQRNSPLSMQEDGYYSDQNSPGADERQKFIPSSDDVSYKGGKVGLRGRQPSNRYVNS